MNIWKRLLARRTETVEDNPDWPASEVLYILRPRDGVRKGKLPEKDGPGGATVAYRVHREEGVDDLYVAVCDFCGGNCGQCGTSIGAGVPFLFDRIVERSGLQKGWRM